MYHEYKPVCAQHKTFCVRTKTRFEIRNLTVRHDGPLLATYRKCMARKRTKPEQNELPDTPRECPQCGSQDLVWHGAIRNAVRQALHNGKPFGQEVAHGKREVIWERLTCVRCGAQCERTDKRLLELREEIERLQFQLAFVTGQLVPENGLPC